MPRKVGLCAAMENGVVAGSNTSNSANRMPVYSAAASITAPPMCGIGKAMGSTSSLVMPIVPTSPLRRRSPCVGMADPFGGRGGSRRVIDPSGVAGGSRRPRERIDACAGQPKLAAHRRGHQVDGDHLEAPVAARVRASAE